jgi:hypothetical protein
LAFRDEEEGDDQLIAMGSGGGFVSGHVTITNAFLLPPQAEPVSHAWQRRRRCLRDESFWFFFQKEHFFLFLSPDQPAGEEAAIGGEDLAGDEAGVVAEQEARGGGIEEITAVAALLRAGVACGLVRWRRGPLPCARGLEQGRF